MRRWKAHRGKIASLSFSRDGQLLASVTGSGRDIFIWDAVAGTLVRQLTVEDVAGKASYQKALGLAFAPEADYLAVTRYDWLEVWDTVTWQRFAEHSGGYEVSIAHEVTVGHGREPLIACSSSRAVSAFWVTESRPGVPRLDSLEWWDGDCVSQLSFSRDGTQLAGHTQHAVEVWDPTTGQKSRWYRHSPSNYAGPVRFSPDSSRLAFCFKTVIESHPATLDDPDAVIRYAGHTDKVWMLRYTPDGCTLISASSDGTVRLWEASTGLEKRCFDMKIGKIAAADVSPDGAVAAVGGANGEIVVWDLE